MIALVHGPDTALARSAVEKLAFEHDPAGTDTTSLDGRTVTIGNVVAAAASVGFFGGCRVVIVTDLMARASKTATEADDRELAKKTKSAATGLDFAALFRSVPPQNLLILVDAALTAIPAAVKRAAPADAQIVAAQPPRGSALVNLVIAIAKEAGGEIESPAARLLLETLYPQSWSSRPTNPRYDRPPDTERLRHEIEKLVLYAHPRPVNSEQVRELISGTPDDRVFRFIEAAASRHLRVAAIELEKLLDSGEEPARLIAQLHQQIELAMVAVAATRQDPVEVGRALGLSNPNRMLGVAQSSRQQTVATARAAIEDAVATDRKLKLGRLRWPVDALYLLATAETMGDGTD
ncbi:MAG: hypothetical protein M3411_06220 [Chloroflexota bacterium]|nr:hypothetical protein [Chloroflexota bacterium]